MSVSDREQEGLDEEAKWNIRCSFCRKSSLEVDQLISAPEEVYICGECVDKCAELVKDYREAHPK